MNAGQPKRTASSLRPDGGRDSPGLEQRKLWRQAAKVVQIYRFADYLLWPAAPQPGERTIFRLLQGKVPQADGHITMSSRDVSREYGIWRQTSLFKGSSAEVLY